MRRLVLLLGPLVLLPLLGADTAADTRVRRGWDYEVTLSPDLAHADVRLCFRRFQPRTLVMRDAAALDDMTVPAGGVALTRSADKRSVSPSGLRPGVCITYRVDLQAAARAGGRRSGGPIGRDLLMDPARLLLRPVVWPSSVYVTCRFICPGGLDVSVPWPAVPGAAAPHTYSVPLAGVNMDAVIALGRFTTQLVTQSGATFRVARLDRPHKASGEDIEAWLQTAAKAVALLYRRFPHTSVQVLVVPSGGSSSAIQFGRARRAGGACLTFYLSATADRSSMVGEWVGVHEMVHLGMPWTAPGEDWLQEGFTTYYQEVLRARAGIQSVTEGWQQLHEGFGRGQRGRNQATLGEASRTMHQTHAYWRVYWGGCAIALLCDLEIRRVTKGQRTLDDVMRLLEPRRGRTTGPQRGLDLLRQADRWLGSPVCVPIAERLLATKGFPDLGATYRELGLVVENGRVRLDPKAPRAADALTIMRQPGRAE